MDDQLKNCPLCDHAASIVKFGDEGDGETFCVVCTFCDCSMGDESYGDYHIGEGMNCGAYSSEQDAVAAWNYRFND